jgi:hypothetical protein
VFAGLHRPDRLPHGPRGRPRCAQRRREHHVDVVQSIVWVIVLDAIFAVVLQRLGI